MSGLLLLFESNRAVAYGWAILSLDQERNITNIA